jgi:hypothetical protein
MRNIQFANGLKVSGTSDTGFSLWGLARSIRIVPLRQKIHTRQIVRSESNIRSDRNKFARRNEAAYELPWCGGIDKFGGNCQAGVLWANGLIAQSDGANPGRGSLGQQMLR